MITLSKKQEEDIDKLVQEGIIQNKDQFVKQALAKHLNKSEIKRELKRIDPNRLKKLDKDKIRRIGIKFNDELEDIKNKRLKQNKEKNSISNGKLTNMIPKHPNWAEIKEDLINHDFNKK